MVSVPQGASTADSARNLRLRAREVQIPWGCVVLENRDRGFVERVPEVARFEVLFVQGNGHNHDHRRGLGQLKHGYDLGYPRAPWGRSNYFVPSI